jgi:hypothetical protein
LDYRLYRKLENEGEIAQAKPDIEPDGSIFRFSGNVESITDGKTLWIRGDDLTIPISLDKTKCFLLPIYEGEEEPQAPDQIRWNRVSTLSEGIKVFIGGQVKIKNNKLNFISTKEQPLMVIFYSCPDNELSENTIRASRIQNEYWNNFTPVFLVIGALILISIAASFLGRPAFRLTVINAFLAVFIPILPFLPPGFLFTVLYRRLSWNTRKLRAERDLIHYGFTPDKPKNLTRRYAIRAYVQEVITWILMLMGISLNIIFIFLILYLFDIISF